ncbi:hypothetical protein Hte_005214 [Hypoxylon texense]
MVSLCAEDVLAIAEHMDVKSILALKLVNKTFAAIITYYERSISIARSARLRNCVTPSGNVLSSELFLRRNLGFGTFKMVREFEIRDDRIEYILQHRSFINIASPPGLQQLNGAQQDHLRSLLKRSLWICDWIADIAVNKPGAKVQEGAYKPLRTRFYEKGNELEGFRLMNPVTNPRARPYQRDYIQGLPLEDIAMMYYLANALSAIFLQERAGSLESDPTRQEQATVFEESVLRHGSWFLWAHLINDAQWQSLAAKIGRLGLLELLDYETGAHDDDQPGLKQALIRRFRELVGSKKNSLEKVHIVVRRMILGTDETWDDDSDVDDTEAEEEEEDDDADPFFQ